MSVANSNGHRGADKVSHTNVSLFVYALNTSDRGTITSRSRISPALECLDALEIKGFTVQSKGLGAVRCSSARSVALQHGQALGGFVHEMSWGSFWSPCVPCPIRCRTHWRQTPLLVGADKIRGNMLARKSTFLSLSLPTERCVHHSMALTYFFCACLFC